MKELAGAERMEAAIASLSSESRREYEALMPMSWMPVDTAHAVIEAVAREMGRPVSSLHAQVVRIGVERTFKSLWRVILRFTTDKALVSRTRLIYTKTYDRGSLSSDIVRPGRAELVLSDWVDAPKLDLEGLAIGVETVLKVAGRRNVKVNWERRPDGAFYVATWTV